MKKTSLQKIRIFTLGGPLFLILLTVCALWFADIIITYNKSTSQLSEEIRSRELNHIRLYTEDQIAYLNNLGNKLKENSLISMANSVRKAHGMIKKADINYSLSHSDVGILKKISILLNSSPAEEPHLSFFIIHNKKFLNNPGTLSYPAETLYDFCKTNREGFFPKITSKSPQSGLSNIAYIYIKYYEPLDLCIGAVMPTAFIDKTIKEAINKQLKIVNTDKTDYFFTARTHGDSLTGISSDWETISSITPYKGNKNSFLQNPEPGMRGSFVKCDVTSIVTGTTRTRLCYIAPLSVKNMILGFGKHEDSINEIIDSDIKYLSSGKNRSLTAVSAFFILFSLLSVIVTVKLSGIISRQTAVFKKYFLKATKDGTPLDTSSLNIAELIEFSNEINKLLAARKDSENMMKKSIAEKEVLIKEIHHRVKNNLQIIISLIELQTQYADNPDAVTLLKETSGRIRSMGIIHEKIYQTKDLTEVAAKDYFSTIIDELMFSYNVNHKKINIVKNIDDITFNMDTAIPLGLIINELLTNTIKHAFKKDQKGRIHISAKKFTNRTEIIVSDNGIGIPIKEEMDKRSRLGMQLIRGLTMQLGAELSIIAKNGTKTKITIQNT